MIAIAAVDSNWGIGYRGKLLATIPEDMKFFRRTTLEKTVILGRKTLETFPGKKPLPQRDNIILSRDRSFTVPGACVVHSVEEALSVTSDLDPGDVFVIGGESVYRAFLPHTDRAFITKIDHRFEADAFFPDLDADPGWKLSDPGEERTSFDLAYHFTEYVRADRG
ncbi:MAG: dihydrofolate reductase [Lachnospiraceae bacterium]|nr:dihydrofolate reductase [Lachnospiraceae bacterium]